MRGAPQSGLARLMSRINLRISSGTRGLPPRRLDFQRQNDRNPARCQRITVSGRTMVSASTMPGTRRYSPTNANRSKVPKTNLLGELRRSTLICCRRTRFSASSRARERNKPMSADHNRMKNSTMGHEHHPIRLIRQPYRVFDKDTLSTGGRSVTSPPSAPAYRLLRAWRMEREPQSRASGDPIVVRTRGDRLDGGCGEENY